jgi:hypothetical protein
MTLSIIAELNACLIYSSAVMVLNTECRSYNCQSAKCRGAKLAAHQQSNKLLNLHLWLV